MRRKYVPFICLLLLTGCWDRVEVNDVAFVTMSGIDKVKENQFRVIVEVPLPGAMGGAGSTGGGGGTEGGPYYVDSEVGRNVREANDLLQKRMSRKLFFGHRRVIIFGEKLSREGFEKSLNVVLEQPQSRLSSYVLVTKGESMNVINSSPHLEKINAEAFRELSKSYMDTSVKSVLSDIHRPGKDPVLPIVDVVKTKNGESKDKKDEVLIKDFGIYSSDKLIFFANKKESFGVLWLLEKMTRKNFTFPLDKKSELNVHINQVKVKPKANTEGVYPSFTLNIQVDSSMMQNEPFIDLSVKENYQLATRKMEEEIKHQVEAILTHSMKEGSDVYGLGWYLFQYHHRKWEKNWEKNWEEQLPHINVKVNVRAEIGQNINPGLLIKD